MDTSELRKVGENSNAYLNNRRMIRTIKNPMDKCTIVSILPKEITEVKFTIEPGRFHISPGTYEIPAMLVVGPSSWWREIDLEQPMLEIPVSSIQIADSVIRDYCNGMLGCDMDSSMPGLFFLMGEVNRVELKNKYSKELDRAKAKQDAWFKILVKIANSLWARSNGNPLVISDEMRLAARNLNENDVPWLQNFEAAKLINCKFCGGLRNEKYPICQHCKAVDTSHPLAKDIKFAV